MLARQVQLEPPHQPSDQYLKRKFLQTFFFSQLQKGVNLLQATSLAVPVLED
jgi:hypothetical protein